VLIEIATVFGWTMQQLLNSRESSRCSSSPFQIDTNLEDTTLLADRSYLGDREETGRYLTGLHPWWQR